MNIVRQLLAICLCLQVGAVAAAADQPARGEAVYATYCVSCHGVNGQPDLDSPLVQSLEITPANFWVSGF